MVRNLGITVSPSNILRSFPSLRNRWKLNLIIWILGLLEPIPRRSHVFYITLKWLKSLFQCSRHHLKILLTHLSLIFIVGCIYVDRYQLFLLWCAMKTCTICEPNRSLFWSLHFYFGSSNRLVSKPVLLSILLRTAHQFDCGDEKVATTKKWHLCVKNEIRKLFNIIQWQREIYASCEDWMVFVERDRGKKTPLNSAIYIFLPFCLASFAFSFHFPTTMMTPHFCRFCIRLYLCLRLWAPHSLICWKHFHYIVWCDAMRYDNVRHCRNSKTALSLSFISPQII